jgi:type IV secretion system protein VirB10
VGAGAAEAGDGGGEGPGAGDRRLDLPSLSPYRLEARAVPRGRLAGPPRLSAGAVVPLVLTHDVGTDVPGSVRAWVARDVYDSETHSVGVLPRGTVVVGSQAARATVGDRRVLVVWRRLRLPSGVVYELPELPAGSADGTAGVRAEVDRHWWGRFGNAIALSLVGAGVQLSQPQERSAVQGFAPSEGQVVAQQLGVELGRLSQEILRRGIDRPPTLTLSAGQRLSLLVSRDLVFPRVFPGVFPELGVTMRR